MTHANEQRGLRIAGSDFIYLREGYYGAVFVDKDEGRIRKVFLNKNGKEHARQVFEAEACAYEKASGVAELLPLIPGNFIRCQPQRIVDISGQCVSADFFCDLAFETDYVEGTFCKVGSIQSKSVRAVMELFHAADIKNVQDMSVVLDTEGNVVSAIDFAIQEIALWHDD
ncbi:hypothetical protein [Roseibium album]|uniref:hypothetical protein n=1 Tax=Roseibium album TaxID=311410 RepID=UPI002490620D|nr:hypothetical protein [Roseibium album]